MHQSIARRTHVRWTLPQKGWVEPTTIGGEWPPVIFRKQQRIWNIIALACTAETFQFFGFFFQPTNQHSHIIYIYIHIYSTHVLSSILLVLTRPNVAASIFHVSSLSCSLFVVLLSQVVTYLHCFLIRRLIRDHCKSLEIGHISKISGVCFAESNMILAWLKNVVPMGPPKTALFRISHHPSLGGWWFWLMSISMWTEPTWRWLTNVEPN